VPTVRYLSLFSGIGGFELGLDMAGEELGIDFRCVGYSEIDKWALRTYERHFDHRALGDVTQIEPAALPEYDLLVAGFPCQPFSAAGDRLGFDDARGTLFFDVARILQHSRPRHFILENVPGLLGHGFGQTFSTIIGVLTRLGYCVEWQVLDSQDHGIPQSRQRVFLVGHLGGLPQRPVFPIGDNVGRKVDGDPKRSRYGDRVFDGAVEDTGMMALVRSRQREGVVWTARSTVTVIDAHYGSGPGYAGNRTQAGRVDGGVLRIRQLTPLEAERCQGLPDNWTEGHSRTQRFRQTGNSVVPKVVSSIILRLYEGQGIEPTYQP
jgi:DNA (cytosine-5)-methyltransferase 1